MAQRLPPSETTGHRKLKLSAALKLAAERVEDRRTERAAAYLLLVSEEVAWQTGMTYRGHSISRREDGWLLVVRAVGRDGPVVCFSDGATQSAAILYFAYALAHDLLRWSPDKFRK